MPEHDQRDDDRATTVDPGHGLISNPLECHTDHHHQSSDAPSTAVEDDIRRILFDAESALASGRDCLDNPSTLTPEVVANVTAASTAVVNRLLDSAFSKNAEWQQAHQTLTDPLRQYLDPVCGMHDELITAYHYLHMTSMRLLGPNDTEILFPEVSEPPEEPPEVDISWRDKQSEVAYYTQVLSLLKEGIILHDGCPSDGRTPAMQAYQTFAMEQAGVCGFGADALGCETGEQLLKPLAEHVSKIIKDNKTAGSVVDGSDQRTISATTASQAVRES